MLKMPAAKLELCHKEIANDKWQWKCRRPSANGHTDWRQGRPAMQMLFPPKFRPKVSYHQGERKFGARRDHGARHHAGCDLYAPVGTEVLAVAHGTVRHVGPFYRVHHKGLNEEYVWVVEVDHGFCVVRYGEVTKQLPPGIRQGATVVRGQVVGLVGQMAHITHSMLHFEMYSGKAKGALSQPGHKPYMRRSDLLDPTSHLDMALMQAGAIGAVHA